MEVEYLNDILVYLVTWLFGGLYGISTKLPVIVSVYWLVLAFIAPGPLRENTRPGSIYRGNVDGTGI